MAANDLVTVVIPVYNSKNTVAKAVRSVLDQTYNELEIILVNDGSTDDSLDICNKLASEDKRIIVHSQENGGLSAARNKGISLATGKWITFVDSDDVAAPNMIEILMNAAVTANADLSVCNLKEVDTQDIDSEESVSGNVEDKVLEPKDIINGSLLCGIPLYAWGKLYKLELFKDITYPAGRYFEDEITSLKLFCAAKKTAFADLGLYYYVQNTSGITKSPKEKHALDLVANQADIEALLRDKDIDKKALYAHLCSNYTLAYNIISKSSKDRKLLKDIRKKNSDCYKLTDKAAVKSQKNATSIILLHLGLYRILLSIRSIIGKK